MGRKETAYSIKYDHIEEVLLNLGNDIADMEKELLLHEQKDFENVMYLSSFTLIKRIRFLEEIAKELTVIFNDVNDKTKEMINLLYMESKSFEEVSNITGVKEKRILFRHNLIVDEILVMLGHISENDSKVRMKRRKAIPKNIKEKVFKRDKGECTGCGSTESLHYHHIKRYASGGEDTVDNLILLCVDCHAEEHKNESSYHLIKAMAEG